MSNGLNRNYAVCFWPLGGSGWRVEGGCWGGAVSSFASANFRKFLMLHGPRNHFFPNSRIFSLASPLTFSPTPPLPPDRLSTTSGISIAISHTIEVDSFSIFVPFCPSGIDQRARPAFSLSRFFLFSFFNSTQCSQGRACGHRGRSAPSTSPRSAFANNISSGDWGC